MSSREDPLRQYLKSPTRKTLARVARVYHEWVWNCALRVTGNEEDASDVCQDVFLDLLLHPPRAEDLRSARGYFAWRVVGRVQRMRRGEARREAREARAIERAMDSGIGGDLPIEEREAVRDAVARLPDDLRALIELHYGVGLTHQEIAEAVGIPERSVKHRLQQARDRL